MSPPDRIAHRYELLEHIGSGGMGTVYRARDLILEQEVALKRIDAATAEGRLRVAREVAALRRLAFPGVVAIHDDLVWQDAQWIAMAFIDGQPFPGAPLPMSWEALAELASQLLEVVGRMHAVGIVHRDLKPENVLVDAEGRLTLLDFGLARGAELGSTITRSGTLLGTPRYLAPEQVYGFPADARTDLYACALMLYEALAGELPFPGETAAALLEARVTMAPAPLPASVRAPSHVGEALARALTADKEGRPDSAEALLDALGLAAQARRTLPLLGRHSEKQALRAALETGVRVVGPSGCGKSRLVREVLPDARWAEEAQRPYASLASVLPAPPAGQAPAVWFAERLAELTVPVVFDPIEHMDRWTRALVDPGGAGLVVVATEGEGLTLGPLGEAELRSLFAGPDRLLHRREDAARLLHEITAGHPADVVRVTADWLRRGLARQVESDPPTLEVDIARLRKAAGAERLGMRVFDGTLEPALADLLAWVELLGGHAAPGPLAALTGLPSWELELMLEALEREGCLRRAPALRIRTRSAALGRWRRDRLRAANRAVADLLQAGQKLPYLLATSARGPEVVAEAAVVASQLLDGGRYEDVVATLVEVLAELRALDPSCVGHGLAPPLVEAAVLSRRRGTRALARYELERMVGLQPVFRALLAAADDSDTQVPALAVDRLEALGPLPQPALEILRRHLQVRALARPGPDGVEALAALLERLEPWVEASPEDRELQSRAASWRGLAAYRWGRFEEAAAHHSEAAELAPRVAERVEAQLNAGAALLEAGRYGQAEAIGREALATAEQIRLPFLEARAWWVLRSAASRGTEVGEPDLELLEAISVLDVPQLTMQQAFTESVVAMRSNRPQLARQLAEDVALQASRMSVELLQMLAMSMAIAADPHPDDAVQELAERAADAPPRLGLESMALLTRHPAFPRALAARILRRVPELPPDALGVRGGPLSLSEAIAALQAVVTES